MKLFILIIRCIHSRTCLLLILIIFIIILGRLFQHRRNSSNSSMFFNDDDYLFYQRSRNAFNASMFVPGLFLKNVQPRNESYCQYKFGFPNSFKIINSDIAFTPEFGEDSNYRVVYNAIYGNGFISLSDELKRSVTYCTHVTPEFIYYIAEIVNRWEGPVSVSAFVPSTDASLTLCLIERLCHCLQGMEKVSVHFVFPADYPPDHMECQPLSSVPKNYCSLPDVVVKRRLETFRNNEGLIYPVNVGRNVARTSARTSFVLVSDVELFPSHNLVSGFLAMLERLRTKSRSDFRSLLKRFVYVLPVFEVDGDVIEVPKKKSELLNLYAISKAVYFHRWVCLHCQRFPGLQRWLHRHLSILDHTVQPLLVVRREFPYHRWEPVYIGTNQEPLYSELLSWEGQQDKMTQMHEMCLLGYRFVILDGAFLVHAPGMKKRGTTDSGLWRMNHHVKNMAHYDSVIEKMTKRHGSRQSCKVH
ncbi:beta-1,4-glucuronyltransferase 1-like [Lycorma delicatula]|uniref:beta-1,4-glucuronyltransferase 1-like n=1 Tax=Lycorma delicatula TaxID=130591 RepID=UPI003F510BE2